MIHDKPVLCTTKKALLELSIPTEGSHIIPIPLEKVQNLPYHFISQDIVDLDITVGEHYPQIVPYVVLTTVNEFLTYYKSDNVGEQNRSIGFGTHITYEDQKSSLTKTMIDAVVKDLKRKLDYDTVDELTFPEEVFVLVKNDHQTSRMHLGILLALEVKIDEVFLDDSIAGIKWQTLDRLVLNIDEYQPWSQLIIKTFVDFD